MTSITWSFMSACKRNRPRSPSQALDCAQASLHPVPCYPMLFVSPEGIASSRLIIRVCSFHPFSILTPFQSYSIAQNLTTWGFDDCQANTSDGSYGGMLTKLLFRHLPDSYPTGSTYAHFPFMVPSRMKGFAEELPGDVDLKYGWNRPAVPVGPTVVARRYPEVQELLAKPALFTSGVAQRLEILTGGVPLHRFTTLVSPSDTIDCST